MRRFLSILMLSPALILAACDAPRQPPTERRTEMQSVPSETPPAPRNPAPEAVIAPVADASATPEPTASPTPRPLPTRAVGDGRLPLARILAIAQAEVPGEVIEVELDEDDGVEIYEIAILTPAGRKIDMEIDARSGRIIDVEED